MSQVTFPIVILFPFGKHERSAALRTRDFQIWHRGFSTRVILRFLSLSLLFGALALRFFQPQLWNESAFFSNATPKSWRPDGFVAPSLLQQQSVFKFYLNKSVAKDLHHLVPCGKGATHSPAKTLVCARHIGCSVITRSMDLTPK